MPQQNTPDSLDNPDTLSSYSSMSVISPIDGVRIYVDSLFFGFTPQDSIRISSGFHILRFIHPDHRNWFIRAVVETVQLKPHEHIIRDVRFPRLCRITTNPFNATAMMGDSVCGTTPLMIPMTGGGVNLSISKDGFNGITRRFEGDHEQFHIDLERSFIPKMNDGSLYLSPISSKGNTTVYFSAGATLLAGAAAAYFKIKADNSYSDYRLTGDPAALDKVHSLDTASGVSLIVAEISFFLMSYLLFSQ
jgi:hypothetical protein